MKFPTNIIIAVVLILSFLCLGLYYIRNGLIVQYNSTARLTIDSVATVNANVYVYDKLFKENDSLSFQISAIAISSVEFDTLWFPVNTSFDTIVVDSIYAHSSTDNQDINLVKRYKRGGTASTLKSFTITTNGDSMYYTSQTVSGAAAVLRPNYAVGWAYPSVTSNQILIVVYGHTYTSYPEFLRKKE